MTTFTAQEIENFKIALGKSNTFATDRETLIQAGYEIMNAIVETHETEADYIKAHGRPSEKYEADGKVMLKWNNVQFRKGQPRCMVYFMDFGGHAAAMRS